jgi:hypothetical protein
MENNTIKPITIVRKDLCLMLKKAKDKMQHDIASFDELGTTISYADVIDSMLEHLNEVVITQEGRFEGSKALAGKTILYRVK